MKNVHYGVSQVLRGVLMFLVLAGALPLTQAEEVTFVHFSDTHYNTSGEDFEAQRERFWRFIDKINAIPGIPTTGARASPTEIRRKKACSFLSRR